MTKSKRKKTDKNIIGFFCCEWPVVKVFKNLNKGDEENEHKS